MQTITKEIAVLQSRMVELERELHRYRAVERVGWIPHLFYLASLETGLVIYVSQSAAKILGRGPHQLQRWPEDWEAVLHPEDRERVMVAMHVFRGPQDHAKLDHEYRVVRPDGSIRWIRDRIQAIPTRSGDSRWLVGMARDITDNQSTRS